MKLFTMLMFVSLTVTTAVAQPPPHARGPSTLFRDKPEPSSPVRQWMTALSENNPAEYERLQQLRRENPRVFREVIRERMEEQTLERLKANRPTVHDALMQLAPEDRAWVLERMAGPGMQRPDKGKDRDRLEPGSRKLVRDYRETENKPEREAIRKQLHDALGQLYDRRLQERREQLEDLRKRLRKMEAAIEEGEQTREAFIEERLSIWLQ